MVNRQMTQSLNDSISSSSLQLGILLHQLLQAEAWKLYRNLGFFAFSLPLIDGAFAIFRMANALSGAEPAPALGLLEGRRFWNAELLAAAGEEFRDVLD